MATPDFVLELRKSIGHAPLWLIGVTAVVVRGDEALLVRRADNGNWSNVAGVVDPGEEPADAAAREVLEESGLVAEVDALVGVFASEPLQYANGDHAQYLDVLFLCRWVSGEPHPADGENTAAAWWPLDALPPLPGTHDERLRLALAHAGPALFRRRNSPADSPADSPVGTPE
ncbi:NUDIX domain-containing protein [Cryobacterium algoricola]|uniref:NUDIX domain-containing protein n=1 Tax=Cryobacterium algoricola TaxID=1259183 RepID=A0ABY2IAW8_9MICO|nr:NUDIX domain-containing protein [Cryobacterium algoricola]TFB86242.1 NUDIX domain-containing protein [Cryobacterium algoricola]